MINKKKGHTECSVQATLKTTKTVQNKFKKKVHVSTWTTHTDLSKFYANPTNYVAHPFFCTLFNPKPTKTLTQCFLIQGNNIQEANQDIV